jgi:predicted ester cyclase
MSVEEKKEIVRVLVEQIINQRKIDLVDEQFSPNYIFHIPGFPVMDKAGLKQFIKMLSAAFPDFYETIEDLIVDGDKVAGRFSFHDTHKGDFRVISPIGKFSRSK